MDIIPVNNKDVKIDYGNGMEYCEEYFDTGNLAWKGVLVNGEDYGYFEYYYDDGSIDVDFTGYCFNDYKVSANNEEGYCLIWSKAVLMSKNVWLDYGNGMRYCEDYCSASGRLSWKGVMVGGVAYGYHKGYLDNTDKPDEYSTGYFSDNVKVSEDNEKGYCIIWCKGVVV